jgi:hypothetical protein
MKTTIICSKIQQTLQTNRIEDREQCFFRKPFQIQNKIRTKIPGSKTSFEFRPNLLGVQIGLEKSDKFLKIIICRDLPNCEFRFAWLFGKTSCFHTSSRGLGFKEIGNRD